MGAQWSRNTLDPLQRLAKLTIVADGGLTYAPRGTDFMALGIVFLGDNSNLVLATGTMTNDRHPYEPANIVITATDQVNDRVTVVGHNRETGDGPFKPSATGGGVDLGTFYWLIKYSDDEFSFADSLANAYAGVKVDLTADLTGVTVQTQPTLTTRGIDGRFTYTGTQAESDRGVSELGLYVEGPGFRLKNGGGTYTSISIANAFAGSPLGVRDMTVMDGIRTLVRGEVNNFDVDEEGNYTHYKDDGVTVSHKGKVTDAGRTLTEVVDPT